MNDPVSSQFVVEETEAQVRLDTFLAAKLPQFSRTVIRKAIVNGSVSVDGEQRKSSYKLRVGESVCSEITPVVKEGEIGEDIPLDILYEDDDMVFINKPTGMVVHPAKGHWSGTLTSALTFHFENLSKVGGAHRPGIVHRLDRDTSGVIVVAKNDQAHAHLSNQFANRTVEKEYYAICRGSLDRDRDWIRQPIGAHPYQREKMAIRADHATSRAAETFFEVQERWRGFVAVSVFPKTGRTHQIRVHLTHVGCPVLCDPLYSGHRKLTAADLSPKRSASKEDILLDRLALHAKRLKIRQPTTGEWLEMEAPIPAPLIDVTQFFSK